MTKRQYKHDLLITFYGNARVRRNAERSAGVASRRQLQKADVQEQQVAQPYFVNNKGKLQSVVAGIKKQLCIVANVLLDTVTELEQG